MMEDEGFASYVAALRAGSTDPYIAFRVYEKGWQVPPEDNALLRRATIRLVEADPWFLATATPHFLRCLRPVDLERLTPFVGVGVARAAAAMLRATLWYHAQRGPEQLRKALAFLQRVPRRQRTVVWHEMLVGCYRSLDYRKYTQAFPELLARTDPEWRASALSAFLRTAAAKKDWATYDRHRPAWDELPASAHRCACYLNNLHTDDGLRAAAARRWDEIPEALAKAGAMHGCAHLNSFGARLDLARMLVTRKKHREPTRLYLERAAAFGAADEVAKLLDAVR